MGPEGEGRRALAAQSLCSGFCETVPGISFSEATPPCRPSIRWSSRSITRRRSCRCCCAGSTRCSTRSTRRPRRSSSTTARATPPIVLEAKARADARYRFVTLSRNFGHQIAITTGMDRAAGQAVIVMDADLQDPPEVVLDMVAKWKEGYEVVYAERAVARGREPLQAAHRRSLLSSARRSSATSTFRATSAISASSTARRSTAFSPCPSATASCAACSPGSASAKPSCNSTARRAPPGETKYSLIKMIAPRRQRRRLVLRRAAAPRAVGGARDFRARASLYGLWVIAHVGDERQLARGWSSIVVVMAFLGGANMLMTGVIGRLRRAHLRRSEALPALRRRTRRRLRG